MSSGKNIRVEYHHVTQKEPHIQQQLEQLQNEKKIDQYEIFRSDRTTPVQRDLTRGGIRRCATERYDEALKWAQKERLELRPYFYKDNQLIHFPDQYLFVYKESRICGVFPSVDDSKENRIEDCLKALKTGHGWYAWNSKNYSKTRKTSYHDAIKVYIRENNVIEDDWRCFDEECELEGGVNERSGRIDLVYNHIRKEEVLLIEIKTSEKEIDKAFGQVLRYKYQFLDDRLVPNVSPQDVSLAIVAPRFSTAHKKAAKEIGIKLIELLYE